MKKQNIVLIGMPGAGKSTIGVVLAKVMRYQFLDSDLVIQEQEGCLLQEIIDKQGLEEFIDIENRVNASLDVKNTVIATGGSVVYGKEAMEHLRSIGTIVYIKLSYSTICSRLGNLAQRGVALKENQDLKGLYEERCPLYETYADVTVDAEGLSIVELMQKIKELV